MESLSVIIPVYNCREHLENCVRSVINVNSFCKDMLLREVILVDDGSSDGSSALCDSVACQMSNDDCAVRVIHQHNMGVSSARNEGLRCAVGSYVLFVDSDDTVDPGKLAELMQTVSRDPSIDMAVFGMSFDYYSGDRIYRQDVMHLGVSGKKSIDECREMMYSLFSHNALSSLCSRLIHRSILVDAGLALREDMFLYEDLEFSLRVLRHCENVYFCNEPVYHYRQAGDEGNAGRRLKRIEHIPEIVDRIEEALEPLGGNNDILMSLYLTLAREKIGSSSRKEIEAICEDFKAWIDEHDMLGRIQNSKYAMLLYNKNSTKLKIKRIKTSIRHRIAIIIKKSFGDFRKR